MSLNPVNGRLQLWFEPARRAMRECFSRSVILVLLVLVCISLVGVMALKVSIASTYGSTVLAGIANAVIILILNGVYKKIAVALNDFENHRTDTEVRFSLQALLRKEALEKEKRPIVFTSFADSHANLVQSVSYSRHPLSRSHFCSFSFSHTQYEDNLIIKTFSFQFVNSFISLLYIAYFKNKYGIFGFEEACQVTCLQEVKTQMASIFISLMTVGNVVEVIQPVIVKWFSEKLESCRMCCCRRDKAFVERAQRFAESQSELFAYDSTIDDYAELGIQFAYVNMFVVAFPLAPAVAYLNNLLEHRIDAIKLVFQCQRPRPRPAQDIGSWYYVFHLVSLISVANNACLLAFTSTSLSATGLTWLQIIAIFENISLLVKALVAFCVRDTPKKIKLLQERHAFVVNRYVYLQNDDDDDDARIKLPRVEQNVADADESDTEEGAHASLLDVANGLGEALEKLGRVGAHSVDSHKSGGSASASAPA